MKFSIINQYLYPYYLKMLYQVLARMPDQDATFVNGYSLFTCCNAEVVFELVPRRASQLALIFLVIKHQCRI